MSYSRFGRSIASLMLAAIAIGSVDPPFAADRHDAAGSRSIHVRYDDLNLRTESGVRAVLARVNRAAKKVCGAKPDYSALLPRSRSEFAKCRIEANQRAIATLNQPAVTAAYASQIRP